MAQTPRNKPTSSGPGRGTPRSRTAARPGERNATRRTSTRRVTPQEQQDDRAQSPNGATAAPNRAVSLTWRFLIVGVVLAMIAISMAQSLRVYFAQAQEIADLRAQIQASREQNAGLQDQLERWHDPDYVRAMARERLGWVMPGETGYRVIGADGEPLTGQEDVLGAEDQTADGPWFERMWGSVALADHPVENEVADDPADEPAPTQTPSDEETP